MVNQEFMKILQIETQVSDLGKENLLDTFPEFGKEIGHAINTGEVIAFSQELGEQLLSMDIYKASLLTNFIGFVCEKTEDTKAGQNVLVFFVHVCNLVYDLFQYIEENEQEILLEDKEKLYALNAEWAKAYFGFNIVCVAVMAFLTRNVALRIALLKMDIGNKTQYLAEEAPESPYLRSIRYVDAMPLTCSQLNLLVLNPEQKKGFLATANDLKNCFHLLFLLEEQIYQNLRKDYGMTAFNADPALVRLAHGEYPKDCWGKSYSTYFMELNYSSVFTAKEDLGKENMYPLIWGEMSPNYIPVVDNYAVIVLWKKGISRSFSGEFMAVDHPVLNPYVKIEKELSEEEYNTWLQKIKLAMQNNQQE